MKHFMFLIFCLIPGISVYSQNYIASEGYTSFFSSAPLEDIKAETNKVSSALNIQTGEIVFLIPITSFRFENKLMEEHFNENYMESEKFPKANFKGTIVNNKEVNYSKYGITRVTVQGEMNIHGVTKPFEAQGQIEVRGEELIAKAAFIIKPEDYKIEIPRLVRENIAREVEVKVDISYVLQKKGS